MLAFSHVLSNDVCRSLRHRDYLRWPCGSICGSHSDCERAGPRRGADDRDAGRVQQPLECLVAPQRPGQSVHQASPAISLGGVETNGSAGNPPTAHFDPARGPDAANRSPGLLSLLCVRNIAIAATSCWIDQFSGFEQRCRVCAGRATICCARRATRSSQVEEFTISHWTRVEFSSLIAREVCIGQPGRSSGRAGRCPVRGHARRVHFLSPAERRCRFGQTLYRRVRNRNASRRCSHLAIANNHDAAVIYTHHWRGHG